MKGPYLSVKKAAKYCGKSEAAFLEWLALFEIPFRGPSGDVIAVADLDDFMLRPQNFLRAGFRPKSRSSEAPSILRGPVGEARKKILDRKKTSAISKSDAACQKERPETLVSDVPGARA